MSRLQQSFDTFRAAGRRALLPYVTAGLPDVDTTLAILRRVDPQQCVCVELGIPFSDPIADGPVIQASFQAALAAGFRVSTLFDALRAARQDIAIPLVAMVSYSIVYRCEPAQFVAAACAAGLDGLIVPDLAFEEADELAAICHAQGCPLVMMVAPTTAADRRTRIAALSEPFVYYQSLAGVTGERAALPPDLPVHIAELRKLTSKPICVGFGISTAEQVRAVCQVADGAIVGSAIVRRMNDGVARQVGRDALAASVADFIGELAQGLL